MPPQASPALVKQAVHTIQMLAVDAIEQARSGHPGAPMGLASVAYEIWMRELRFDPADPGWPGRDRFVLSCGHASMLLYALLHLSGYALSLDELKRFRQWGSKTPGHPEARHTPGVEVTTGPLGQGIATAVGIAAGARMLGARFNPHEPGLFAARVFVLASDGDMMEGLSGEASSLAGHLGLGNLVVFYDDNRVSIDGPTSLSFSEDVGRRFEAYGWHVQHVDGHDHAAIGLALERAVAEEGRPSLVVARTHIAMGAPRLQDSSEAHGAPLGPEETAATKRSIGWPQEPTFLVPEPVRAHFTQRAAEGAAARAAWLVKERALLGRGGEPAELYRKLTRRELPDGVLRQLIEAVPVKDEATRVLSGIVEQRAAALVPSLVGGSADLTPSNKTYIKGAPAIARGRFDGRNLHFGIREHAMAAFANGLALTDAFVPFVATFLVFCDYLRPAVRLSALSRLQVVYVFTHDSLYVGEDGPTHQPVEHLWALRAIPNLDVIRPADGIECAAAWAHALGRRDGPTALVLSRQSLPSLPRASGFDPDLVLRGGYVLLEPAHAQPEAVLVATGSEVSVALAAAQKLQAEGRRLRVVSLPCLEAFRRQDSGYRDAVLPPSVPRAAIELGLGWPWRALVGEDGLVLGHDSFGMSAPWEVIRDKLGFDAEAVAEKIRRWLAS
ncbi:MAG: transketolase [Deltaproteobacteria bacterium]|nr:transketolase [Deltaproteobacteria bacterium]